MTFPIRIRRSTTAGAVPGAAVFDTDTIAINLADSLLFWRDAGGTVQSISLALASVVLTGSPRAPTPAPGDTSTRIATTSFITSLLGSSPSLGGVPIAPKAALGTNTTQIATTSFVADAIAAVIAASPGALDTLKELADAIGDDANYAATVTTALGNRLRLDAVQTLTEAVRNQGRVNLGAGAVGSQLFKAGTVADVAAILTGGSAGSQIGWLKVPIPDGNFILIQWGRGGGGPVGNASDYGVTFPISHPHDVMGVVLTAWYSSSSTLVSSAMSDLSLSSFAIRTSFVASGGAASATGITTGWISVGY